jgi:hypothetical protein
MLKPDTDFIQISLQWPSSSFDWIFVFSVTRGGGTVVGIATGCGLDD